MTFRAGQTVTGVSLSGPVTGTVIRTRPSIIDRSVLIVDLDVDGEEHNVPAEDCTLVRPARPAPQEDPVTATAETPQQIPAATHGWMHPNRSHLAHWGDGTRVLCGRMVPSGTEIVNTDPHADVPRCSKCDKALQRELKTAVQQHLARGRTDVSAPSEAAAEPQPYVPQVGDDVRVGTGRPDVAVIVNLKGDEAQVLYADETRMWVPARSLSKAHTAQQPEEPQPVPAPATAAPWMVGMTVEFTYGFPEVDTRAQGVIAKIFGDGNRRYNKDCQVKYGKAFYYRNFDDLKPLDGTFELPDNPDADRSDIDEARLAFPFQIGDIITDGHSQKRVLYLNVNHFGLRELNDPVKDERKEGKGVLYVPYGQAASWALASLEEPTATPVPADEQPSDPIRFQVPEFEPVTLGMQQVPWDRILPSPLNPRKAFDGAALKELAISIHSEGLQQNLVVRPHPERHGFYEVAAGERRYRAIGLLVTGFEREGHEWVEVPATYPVNVLVQQLTDLELLQIATAENVQRRRMTPLEEADAFAAMIERGATIPELHARFGLGQRTIARRVEISRHLIPDLRAMYDVGKLTLGQVEILAQATPGLQEDLLRRQLKHTQSTTPEQLKALIHNAVFPTSRAQFPRAWYTGTITAADLFGDMPERFDDFDQAISLQVKHAVAQAQEDVKNGAVFADVVEGPEVQLWRYAKAAQGDSGVVYVVNTRTGELTRHTGYLISPSYPAPQYRFEAPRPAPTHETAATGSGQPATAAATTPARPATTPAARPRYAQYNLQAHVGRHLIMQPTVALAALVFSFAYEGWGYLETEASVKAAAELVRLTDGLLETQGTELTVAVDDDQNQHRLHVVLPALLAAPEQLLRDVFDGMTASMIEASLDTESAGRLVTSGQASWSLTETYLKGCDTLALQEIWDDAGLGDRANTSGEYLRSMLLEEAPALTARGFLPRPLRPDGDAQ